MTETMSATPILDVEGVAVPVADQNEALEFYVGRLGLDVRRDVAMGDGGRWVEVAPPGARTTIALVPTSEGFPVGLKTGIRLTSSDAQAAHAGLSGRGVDVDELLRWPGIPPMFAFRDQDGNELRIIESS